MPTSFNINETKDKLKLLYRQSGKLMAIHMLRSIAEIVLIGRT